MSSLKSSLIFWSRNKGYTAICLFGLAVSLLFVVLIADFTIGELKTDKFHSKGDRIYALGSEKYIGTGYGMKKYLEDKYPQIEDLCFLTTNGGPAEVEGNKFRTSILLADSTFFNFFDFNLIAGDKQTAMRPMNSAIISETFANMAYPGKDPVGMPLNLDGREYTVTGVHKDFKESIFYNYDVIIRLEQIKYYNSSISPNNLNNAGGVAAFILIKDGAAPLAQTDEMLAYFKEFYWIYERGMAKTITFTPLKDIYFSDVKTSIGLNEGDKSMVLILLSVGILILIFAIINYINLTVAQSGFRAKEMATRRLLGASRKEIFSKMITESVLFVAVAAIIAYLLAIGLDKPAGNLVNSELDVIKDMTPLFAFSSIAVIIIVGIISGLIPASIISGFQPIEVVRGTFRRRTKMVFSRIFITFQNIITIVLVACSITMIAQMFYIIHADKGFKSENIISIRNEYFETPAQWSTFKSELMQLPCVKNVSFCQGDPTNRGNNNTTVIREKNISFQTFVGDSAYFDMIGFTILRDNNVSNPISTWLNEAAFRELEITEDTESFPLWGENVMIKGVIKDFQYGNAMTQIGPVMVWENQFQEGQRAYSPSGNTPWTILVQVTGDPFEANDQVEEVFKKTTDGEVYEGTFLDDIIKRTYELQRKATKVLSLFTIIGIIISTLGLLAMSTYFIRQRTLEIAVRKVFGSTDKQITNKLVMNFLSLIGIAFIISVPIIWYLMTKWLSTYVIHINLSAWIFIAAGAITFLIAFLTVITQSVKASHANPTENIHAS